jgi:hypothetical protein
LIANAPQVEPAAPEVTVTASSSATITLPPPKPAATKPAEAKPAEPKKPAEAKPAENKPLEKKVAARPADPAPETKAEHKPEVKTGKKREKHGKAAAKEPNTLQAWEARVMPVIKPDDSSAATKPKHSKKK